MKEQEYIWSVRLDGRSVEVQAQDKFEATKKAAIQLGVRWSKTVRDMEIQRLWRA